MKRSMEDEDSFMRKFKYYKSNKLKPSLEEVICVETYNFAKEVSIVLAILVLYTYCVSQSSNNLTLVFQERYRKTFGTLFQVKLNFREMG